MAKKRAKRSQLHAQYLTRLKALRSIVSGFDAKKFDKLYASRPRTAKGKREKSRELNRVARAFKTARPYLHRPHKLVRPKSPRNLASLKKFVGMTNLKGLRAVPVPTDRADKMRVTFDKKGRVEIREGKARWKSFLFPHKPRDADDLLAMAERMIPKLPRGLYTIKTRHHFLIPTVSDRDALLETLRKFIFQYGGDPAFLLLIIGFQWVAGSYERAAEFQKYMRTERGRAKLERKRVASERAAKVVAEMDRAFKRGKLSKRARATGRR